jgi:ABC-2 type transport system ATP-binding protein
VDGNIIELVDLTKRYGSFSAVDKLNLSVRKGEIFGLLGPNGAGKSTTILMMLGLAEPTSGSANICGIDPARNPVEVKKHVGYLAEDVGFYQNMSGFENLMFTAMLNGLSENVARKNIIQLLTRVGLSGEGEKKAGKYSRGMLQRLGLADVLIKNPEVIILDEPTLGIDPKGIREFLHLIVSLSREEGITVLFSSHDLHQVQKVCDRVGLFVSGRLLAEGDIQSLANKLFSKSPYVIEVAVIQNEQEALNPSISKNNGEWLIKTLKKVDGIISINMNGGIFKIECSRDITTEIAKVIVESGTGLKYLNRKEFGLDDIYNRYFEGGFDHE